MNRRWTRLAAAAVVLAVGALTAAPGAVQQYVKYPGGVSVLTHEFDPAHPDGGKLVSAMNDPALLRQVVNTAWAGARASVQDALKAELGKGNLAGKGITFYDIVLNLPASGDLQVRREAVPAACWKCSTRCRGRTSSSPPRNRRPWANGPTPESR